MKKLTALFLSFAFMFSSLGCGSRQNRVQTGLQNETHADVEEMYTEAAGTIGDYDEKTDRNGHYAEGDDRNAEDADDYVLNRYAGTVPIVYMSDEISAEAMLRLYKFLGREVEGKNIAVKVSTGEPPSSNYLEPGLIKDLVQYVDGTIVECNTAYGGSRSETKMHYQVAKDHGFTDIAEVDIMDEEGSVTIPVKGGVHLTENYVGTHFTKYDGFLVLSHFKGHAMAGFGGAIKNISIGISSAEGKCLIHTAGSSHTSPWGGEQDSFLESMAEAGKSVVDALNGNILYINVMNRLSIDCDCNGTPAEPDIHDIGIFASDDPVALDQACVDYVYMSEGNEAFVERMEKLNAEHVLEYGEEIGLGNCAYTVVMIE